MKSKFGASKIENEKRFWEDDHNPDLNQYFWIRDLAEKKWYVSFFFKW